MNMQPKKGIKKTLILGALALTLSIPVGASAASATRTVGSDSSQAQIFTQSNMDLNALIQHYMQMNKRNWGYTIVPWPSNEVGNSGSVIPSKPAPVIQPSKPIEQPSEPAPVVQPSKPIEQPSEPAPVVQPNKPIQPTQPNTNTDRLTKSEFANQVLSLVNQERSKAGLNALKMTNSTLNLVAMDKAKDLYNNGYFDHTSPTYGSPFDMMKDYGINYSYAGENIAKGQTTPQAVMTAWMNSEGHRANILNANFTTIGIAYYNNVWVQEFIS